MSYQAPLRDLRFALESMVDAAQVSALPGYGEYSADTAALVLEEAARFAQEVLDPINWSGDQHGARWADGEVSSAPGFREAYRQFCEGGWNGLKLPSAFGGQELPQMLATCVEEIWNSGNLSFALCPMLTAGAIEAILLCGDDRQKARYLPKMVAGEWTGTMNLTEPQAGSDLAAVRSRAEPQADGRYRVFGQKIFITWGEQDYTANIVHLVLARLPDAPPGVKGLSLFVVPKYLVNDDGTLGARNDVRCVSIEHKLGIHASPTCALAFGDHGGALGELIGEPNKGLDYMFIMMNLARFSVGVEGVGIAERAWQCARDYAQQRVQGRTLGGQPTIVGHPDVQRLLIDMRCAAEASRALAVMVGAAMDFAARSPDPAQRATMQAVVELLIPVVKAYCTETAQRVAYDAVQVHGGMGFIEETGVAQHYRDARILTIYEGTTAIQANDFVGRKLGRDGGRLAASVLAEMEKTLDELRATGKLPALTRDFSRVLTAGRAICQGVVSFYAGNTALVHAISVPLLMGFGRVAASWALARQALAATRGIGEAADPAFARDKLWVCGHAIASASEELNGLVERLQRQAERIASVPPSLLG